MRGYVCTSNNLKALYTFVLADIGKEFIPALARVSAVGLNCGSPDSGERIYRIVFLFYLWNKV
jgi:hypothetical protein